MAFQQFLALLLIVFWFFVVPIVIVDSRNKKRSTVIYISSTIIILISLAFGFSLYHQYTMQNPERNTWDLIKNSIVDTPKAGMALGYSLPMIFFG